MLTIHVRLVPRLRMVGPYVHSSIHLHGVVLNLLSTGKTLTFIDFITKQQNYSTVWINMQKDGSDV
jgi:hypothetical protein